MKIALLGYGKMGKTIEEIAVNRGHEIVLKLEEDIDLYSDLAVNSLLAAKKFNRKTLALEMLSHVEEVVRA